MVLVSFHLGLTTVLTKNVLISSESKNRLGSISAEKRISAEKVFRLNRGTDLELTRTRFKEVKTDATATAADHSSNLLTAMIARITALLDCLIVKTRRDDEDLEF